MAIIQLGCSKLVTYLDHFYCAQSAPQERLKQGSESPAEMIFPTGVHVQWDPFSLRVLFSVKVHFFMHTSSQPGGYEFHLLLTCPG